MCAFENEKSLLEHNGTLCKLLINGADFSKVKQRGCILWFLRIFENAVPVAFKRMRNLVDVTYFGCLNWNSFGFGDIHHWLIGVDKIGTKIEAGKGWSDDLGLWSRGNTFSCQLIKVKSWTSLFRRKVELIPSRRPDSLSNIADNKSRSSQIKHQFAR